MLSSIFSITNIYFFFFFFNDPATTEIYTLSLHDALPIYTGFAGAATAGGVAPLGAATGGAAVGGGAVVAQPSKRSEEHTSELQSHVNLVCRLLLEKKKKKIK